MTNWEKTGCDRVGVRHRGAGIRHQSYRTTHYILLPPRAASGASKWRSGRIRPQRGSGGLPIGEIDAVFATLARERPDALFVAPDGFFANRRGQFATMATVNEIPTSVPDRESLAAGGLMSYGTDFVDANRQVGVYTGSILKGAKPADLPALQSTKFEFVINLQTVRALGIEVPPSVLAIADEVIE
jgi:hypothetical protein